MEVAALMSGTRPAMLGDVDAERPVRFRDVLASASCAYGLIRFGLGLKRFLHEPVSISVARAIIQQRLEVRDRTFLDLIERAVFSNPGNPYFRLFDVAGCELGDVTTLVRSEGVEGALRRLLEAGVYVAYDEFKGRRPAVRGSCSLYFRDTDFDNVSVTSHYRTRSGGSRGRPTRIMVDLEYLADRTPLWGIWFALHNLLFSPLVFLRPYDPGIVNLQLICAKFGNRFVKWFATANGGSAPYRLVSFYLHTLLRWAGGFPGPQFVRTLDAAAIGEYLAGLVHAGLTPVVNASPSEAIRVGLAMQKRGMRLDKVTFLLGYEPLTPARRRTIEATGARPVMTYGFSEGGTVGQQCPWPSVADDVHVATDAIAASYDLPSVLLVRGGSRTAELVAGRFPQQLTQLLLAEYCKASLIVAVARHLAQGLRRLGLDRVRTIQNTVDLGAFSPRPKKSALLQKLGLSGDEVVVMHVANLQARKRSLDVVWSADSALRQDRSLVYVIVGDGPLRATMELACRERQLAERFRFVGWVPYHQVPDYVNLADLVVMPSEAEGLSRVYLETQASGRVLLASDIPAAREVVVHGETGLLFSKGDIEDLAKKTLLAASDPGLRADIGHRARERVRAHSLGDGIAAYASTIARVVEQHRCGKTGPERRVQPVGRAPS